MSEMNWEYIAGFIDGEGCFTISTQNYYYHPRIRISQNTKKVLNIIKDFLKKNGIRSSIIRNANKQRNNVYYNLDIMDRKSLLKMCEFLEDKLIVKAKQRTVMSKLLKIKSGDKTRMDKKQRIINVKRSQLCREEVMRLN